MSEIPKVAPSSIKKETDPTKIRINGVQPEVLGKKIKLYKSMKPKDIEKLLQDKLKER